MPRRLERILAPLHEDGALREAVDELGAEAFTDGLSEGWPGDRHDAKEIAAAHVFIAGFERRAELLARVGAELRAELARVEQLDEAG
jgi:hypothetical protein